MFDPDKYTDVKSITTLTNVSSGVSVAKKAYDPDSGAPLPDEVTTITTDALNAELTALQARVTSLQTLLTDIAALPAYVAPTPAPSINPALL
jgi:hypothetical protein